MTSFIKNGNTYRTIDESSLIVLDKLPNGNYIIEKDQYGNFFFREVELFSLPDKLYCDLPKQTERILSTFKSRSTSTGVMLSGEKGSGKSLLAKSISVSALKQNIPTIIINSPLTGDSFNKLIQEIEQPAIILFDEFEKVYDCNDQEAVLTLLDGVFPTKKLFIITCNNKWKIDSNMRNRPGRIYYLIDFSGLKESFIEEYCLDNLENKNNINLIISFTKFFNNFNFDMLKALVEELNRYNESLEETIKLLNIKTDISDYKNYNVDLKIAGDDFQAVAEDCKIRKTNPLLDKIFNIDWYDTENYFRSVKFTINDLIDVNNDEGKYIYKNPKGDVVTLTLIKDNDYVDTFKKLLS